MISFSFQNMAHKVKSVGTKHYKKQTVKHIIAPQYKKLQVDSIRDDQIHPKTRE